jgi:ribulose-5-phosphate 4-epimerase/fuculose-1-phosphate aldolase
VFDDVTRFLINPKRHFSRIKASDLLLLDTKEPPDFKHPDAPDVTAWGLHGSIHRHCPHARCVMHVHPIYATVLASLADSNLPPIDQNSAIFYKRYVIDEEYGGLAFEKEGERCAEMLNDPKIKVMIMGNHGVLVIGSNVADTFNRLYYFERAAETYTKHKLVFEGSVFTNDLERPFTFLTSTFSSFLQELSSLSGTCSLSSISNLLLLFSDILDKLETLEKLIVAASHAYHTPKENSSKRFEIEEREQVPDKDESSCKNDEKVEVRKVKGRSRSFVKTLGCPVQSALM